MEYQTSGYFSSGIQELEELILNLKTVEEIYNQFVENNKEELEALNNLILNNNLNLYVLKTDVHREKEE